MDSRSRRSRSWLLRVSGHAGTCVCLVAVACGTGGAKSPDDPTGPVITYQLPVPASLGPGYVDLTQPILDASKFVYRPPTPSDLTWSADGVIGCFGDLDGDGLPEIALSHYLGDPKLAANEFYKYDAAAGKVAPLAAAPMIPIDAIVTAIIDLDGDGNNDLLFYEYNALLVRWGLGNGQYGDILPVRAAAPADALATFYLDDLDSDGWLDLLAAGSGCDQASGSNLCPLLRTGPRTWQTRADLVPGSSAVRVPWVVFSATIVPGEKLLSSLGLSDKASQPMYFRQSGLTADGYPRFAVFDVTPPAEGGLSFTQAFGGPMGAAIGDLDGDGILDLGVTLQYDHGCFQGQPSWPMNNLTMTSGFQRIFADSGHAMIPWSMAFIDIDQDGRLDVISTHGNDDGAFLQKELYVGPQFVSASWNGGSMHFADMTKESGLGRRGQWLSLAVGDLDGDGDADLIVGAEVESARLYRNDVSTGNHGFALRLKGTSSNFFGMGARVDVTVSGIADQHLAMQPNASRNSLSEPILFVGIGKATSADKVRITWPSGTVQELANLAAGRSYVVEEPKLFTIDPPSRQAAADGASHVTLHVTPSGPDGTLRAQAVVTARITAGAGALVSPVASPGGGFDVVLNGPASAGSTVVEISVDGVASPIRPRIFWRN